MSTSILKKLPSAFSTRFVSAETGRQLTALCLELRRQPNCTPYSKDEIKQLAVLAMETGDSKKKPSCSTEKLIETLTHELNQSFNTLFHRAQVLRTGGSVGFMAPETYDRGDAIQVALWIVDHYS